MVASMNNLRGRGYKRNLNEIDSEAFWSRFSQEGYAFWSCLTQVSDSLIGPTTQSLVVLPKLQSCYH